METDRDKKNPLRGRGAISAAGGDLSEFGRTEHSLHFLWGCLHVCSIKDLYMPMKDCQFMLL